MRAPTGAAAGVRVACGCGHISSCALPWFGNTSAGGAGLRPWAGMSPSPPPLGSSVSRGTGAAMSLIRFGGSPPALPCSSSHSKNLAERYELRAWADVLELLVKGF